MARTRSILIDNTIGRIFSAVDKSTNATAKSLIAGAVQQNRILSQGPSAVVIAAVNLGKGVSLGPAGAVVNSIVTKLGSAAKAASVLITVKTGTAYATATTVTTITIPANTLTVTYSTSFSVVANGYIYLDVAYSGAPTTKAVGLSTTINYFQNAS